MDSNGSHERRVQAGPIALEVDRHEGLVVLTLINLDGDKIELPMTAQESIQLGKFLITQGSLADV